MRTEDLAILDDVPFLFWVKDEGGEYLWGNRAIARLAGEEVAGKTDRDLVWAQDADALQAADRKVLESGNPCTLHESVGKSSQGPVTYSVCKWAGEFEGRRCSFGISFKIG